MTVDWNIAQFRAELEERVLATGRGADDIVEEQTKLFLGDVVKLTPPMGKSPFNENLSIQHEIGKKAIAKDIRRAFIPIEDLSILETPKDLKLAERIERYAKREEYDQLKELFQKVGIRNNLAAFPTEHLHDAVRNRRGRVPKGTKQTIVVRRGTVEDFAKKKEGLSGKAKSGWAKACEAMGVKLPNWIKKHAAPGLFQRTRSATAPSITVGNLVPYIQAAGQDLRIINRALERRTESMRHQTEKLLGRTFSGYGKH